MANSRSFPYLPFGQREHSRQVKFPGSEELTGSLEVITSEQADEESVPLFSVVSGNPTDEELTALVAIFSALQAQQEQHDNLAIALWHRQLNRGQRLGERLRPGPGSWRRARPM